jgi:hypothetical protein
MEGDNEDAIPPVLIQARGWPIPHGLNDHILGVQMKAPADMIPHQDCAIARGCQLFSRTLRRGITFDNQGRSTPRTAQLRYGTIDTRLPIRRKSFESIRILLKEIACLQPVSVISGVREQLVSAVLTRGQMRQTVVAAVLEESPEEKVVLHHLGILGHVFGGLIEI